MKIEQGRIVMDDGTSYYCHAGIVGLDGEGNLTYGYDGSLDDWTNDEERGQLRKEHRREIAEFMIALWTKYRDERC